MLILYKTKNLIFEKHNTLTNQRTRGKHPNDDRLFGKKWPPIFKEALDDLCYLLSRGYGENSSVQLVGNRYRLNSRQQKALSRMSATHEAIEQRQLKKLKIQALTNKTIAIDGFNLLILLESALSGAFIFQARDGNYKDLSSVHGSYKRVMNTEQAITMVGDTLKELQVNSVHWYFDTPVSNSGRLKGILLEIATQKGYTWEVTLDYNPDRVLAESKDVVVSSDGWILDQTEQWFDLGRYLVQCKLSFFVFFVVRIHRGIFRVHFFSSHRNIEFPVNLDLLFLSFFDKSKNLFF